MQGRTKNTGLGVRLSLDFGSVPLQLRDIGQMSLSLSFSHVKWENARSLMEIVPNAESGVSICVFYYGQHKKNKVSGSLLQSV